MRPLTLEVVVGAVAERPRQRGLSDHIQELEDSHRQQVSGSFVVRRQTCIGKEMLCAFVEEKPAVVVTVHQRSGRIEVAFVNEELVGVHSVDL